MLEPLQVFTAAVALITLLGVSFGRLPGLTLNRSGIALLGSSALLVSGVMGLPEAWRLIDGDVIILLFGLMVVNAALTHAGFFRLLTRWLLGRATSTFGLLLYLIVAAGLLSALFLNDTIALMLTPLVLSVTRALGRPPLPYLLALAMSVNIGSTAAVTGNPQNLIIAVRGGIGFVPFSLALAPVALLGLAALALLLVAGFPREFWRVPLGEVPAYPLTLERGLLARCLVVTLGMLAAFVLGAPVPVAALTAAVAMLLVARLPSDKLLAELDWNLLVLFAGLFVVVGALETSGLSAQFLAALAPKLSDGVAALSVLTALLSNLFSNVPAVLLLAPIVTELGDRARDWLALAMASTLAGNLTLLGSVANLIVVEIARRDGEHVGFFDHLRLGVPVTVVTLFIGVLWLAFVGS